MLSPCRKIPVQCRVDPVFVFRDRHLAIVRCDGLRNTAEVGQCVVVDTDSVGDITTGHAFSVKILAVRQCRHKYSYLGFDFRVVTVAEPQGFPCIIQFQIDAGIPLNMERCIPAAKPVCVTSAVLAVTQRSFTFDFSCGVVFLPQVLQGFSLAGKHTVDLLRVKVPIQLAFRAFPGFRYRHSAINSLVTFSDSGYENCSHSLNRFRNSFTAVLPSPVTAAISLPLIPFVKWSDRIRL